MAGQAELKNPTKTLFKDGACVIDISKYAVKWVYINSYTGFINTEGMDSIYANVSREEISN